MPQSVPDSVTVDNMTGTYNMEKKISDDADPILKLQGVSWMVRTAISYSAVEMSLNHYNGDDGIGHLDMTTSSTGGMTNSEERLLSWQFRENTDKIFGQVKSKSRIIKFSELPADLPEPLKTGWDKEITEGNVFQNYVESVNNGWVAHQLWGFGQKDGLRRHMRKIVVTKDSQIESITMYYDWAE